jgi:hypothetical protein
VAWHAAGLRGSAGRAGAAVTRVLAAGGLSGRDLSGLLLLALIAAAVYLGSCRIWPLLRHGATRKEY